MGADGPSGPRCRRVRSPSPSCCGSPRARTSEVWGRGCSPPPSLRGWNDGSASDGGTPRLGSPGRSDVSLGSSRSSSGSGPRGPGAVGRPSGGRTSPSPPPKRRRGEGGSTVACRSVAHGLPASMFGVNAGNLGSEPSVGLGKHRSGLPLRPVMDFSSGSARPYASSLDSKLDITHSVEHYRGLYICNRCGCVATVSSRDSGLFSRCLGKASSRRHSENLSRYRRHLPPSNWKRWPNARD